MTCEKPYAPPGLPGLNDLPAQLLQGPALAGFQLVDADPEGADELIQTRGTTIAYWKAVPCPCTRTDSGRARRQCPVCQGSTFAYPVDLRCQEMKVLMPGQNRSQGFNPAGGSVDGGTSVTFMRQVTPQRGDLIFPRGQTHLVDEVVVRPFNPMQDLSLKRTSDLNEIPDDTPGEDLLRYPEVVEILGVWGWNPDAGRAVLKQFGATTVGGLLPGQLEAFYAASMPRYTAADFDLLNGNLIRWKPGRGPAQGTSYTVKYSARATYMVAEEPAVRFDGDVELPRRPARVIRYDAMGQEMRERGVMQGE